ncbi:fibronectin type III domain-containing protein [Geomonas nitrogeniifigens]|uniref:Fibronectin type III domain-containing protein n=1 Tax=Geomonas diazotrophica TaxID=2843197 RepID=A0ABX8JF75_9BACT|nr:fibronectin type III domain-containing protein [Geomonas nitrogeniifigens]QWV96388.1 fibronectin type III domain-containing protein [Geomonas nitrogeniifigens]QXE85455.1 fibronectin type III domain-containing protein [Geomonas nitrogeniifigens]
MSVFDKFVMNHADMDPPELVLWLDDAATLQAAHPKISTQKDGWVPGADQFRGHKEAISREWERATALNQLTTKELDAVISAALEDVHINASYLVLRAKHEKDDAWLHNNGYQPKEKTKRTYDRSVGSVALMLRAKNGPNIGEVTLIWVRDPGAGSYLLQICKGHPQGEESYADYGYLKKVRTVVGNLERASWYYFRIRSIGNNELGPWSEPVAIIVT